MRLLNTGVSILDLSEVFNVPSINEQKAVQTDSAFKGYLDEKTNKFATSRSSIETNRSRTERGQDKVVAQTKKRMMSEKTNTIEHGCIKETTESDSIGIKKENSKEDSSVLDGENVDVFINDGKYVFYKDVERKLKEFPEEIADSLLVALRNSLEANFGAVGDLDLNETLNYEIAEALRQLPGINVDQKTVNDLTEFIALNLSKLQSPETTNSLETSQGIFETIKLPESIDNKAEIVNKSVEMEQVSLAEKELGNDITLPGFTIEHNAPRLKTEDTEQINEVRRVNMWPFAEPLTDLEPVFSENSGDDIFAQLLKENEIITLNNNGKGVDTKVNLSLDTIDVLAKSDIISEAVIQEHEIVTSREEIVFQIVEKAKIMLSDEKHEMVVDLKPDNLGKLSLKVVTERGVVLAQFVAENEQVKSILESNMQFLKDALEKQGLNLNQCEVSVGQNGKEGTQRDNPYRRNSYNRTKVKAANVDTSLGYNFVESGIIYEFYDMPNGSKINLRA